MHREGALRNQIRSWFYPRLVFYPRLGFRLFLIFAFQFRTFPVLQFRNQSRDVILSAAKDPYELIDLILPLSAVSFPALLLMLLLLLPFT